MYGYKSVEMLSILLGAKPGEIPAGKFMDIPARQIRKDTVAEFRADLNAKLGKKP
jgi:hypothetical protein